ncbi:MAG: gliding motility-associated C-terminal domain-containing protein [Flavobacteriales bacterium]
MWNSSNGELSNSGIPQPVVNPNSTAIYSVEVTSSEGCVEEAEVEILVSTVESISINIPENPYCENENTLIESAIIGSSNNVAYQWSGVGVGANETQSSLQYSTSETTDISLEITETISGCVYNTSQQIEVYEYPVVTILPESVTACDVQGMTVEGSTSYAGAMSWTWAPANAVADDAAQSTTLTTNASTTLELVGTNEAGCSGTAQIEITVQTAITDLGADQDACVGEVVTLDTGWPATYTFQWDHGPTSPAVLITQSGVYHVQVTTPEGCVSEDQVERTFHEVPNVNLGFDVAGCIGESVTLDAGNPGLMYDWSNGSQSQMISVTEPDNYIVVVSNGFCSDVDDINVFFNPIPENPFDDEVISFCFSLPPYIVRLDAQNEGSTFVWDDSSEGQIYNAAQPGVYTVDISTDFGCTASYSAIIEEDCPGAIYAPNAFTPDGDGLNDVWVVEGYNINTYNLRIWNRWGELMFETNSLKRPWLGQRRDGDEYVEAGVYHYRITYTIDLGDKGISEEMEIDGQVTLIR